MSLIISADVGLIKGIGNGDYIQDMNNQELREVIFIKIASESPALWAGFFILGGHFL